MSRALVDVHQIGLGQTGNETWARNIVGALERDGGASLHYAVTPAAPSRAVPVDRRHEVSTRSAVRLGRDLPRLLRDLRPGAILCQYTLPPTRTPGVVVVHDLSFVHREAREWLGRPTLLRYRATIGASVRRARAVVVPSQHTREDLLRAYDVDPERVFVAPLALDRQLADVLRVVPRRPVAGRVLVVGTVLPRKNVLVVARSVAALRAQGTQCTLRLVGPVRKEGLGQVARARELLGEALEVIGPVGVTDLAREYSQAAVMAFPSLFEGFGLPLLEAMQAGVPIVSSSSSCLPEIAGDAALLVEPGDVDAWVDAVARLVHEPLTAERLVRRGEARVREFRWARTGAGVRAALALALGDGRGSTCG